MASNDTGVPPEWKAEFFDRADLVKAYDILEGTRHFYGEVLRGRIRSLELRTQEASLHFKEASRRARNCKDSIPNLIRQFILSIYAFDNALAERQVERGGEVRRSWMPEVPGFLLKNQPELRLVFMLRKTTEAVWQLHLGNHVLAKDLFEELIEDEDRKNAETLPTYYLGVAAAEHNLGLPALALRDLKTAGTCIRGAKHLLTRGRWGAMLSAMYEYLEKPAEAEAWRSFVEELSCPDYTKKVFFRRGQRFIERSVAVGNLVLI
jgi:hypothetical protein